MTLLPTFRATMARRLSAAVLALLFILAAVGGARAQSWWIQVESQKSLATTESRARIFAARFPETHAFKTHSGWYAIVLGPYSRKIANELVRSLKFERRIPGDSIVSNGRSHSGQVWPAGTGVAVATPATEPEPEPEPAPKPEPEPAPKPEPKPAVKDEGGNPPAAEPEPIPDPDIRATRSYERTWSRDRKKEYQRYLVWTGDYKGAIDGAYGPGTRRAISAFQKREGYQQTGYLTEAQAALLKKRYDDMLAGLGVETLRDVDAGIEILMPVKLVEFDRFEPPFVHYRAKGAANVRVDLISEQGGRDVLNSLYDIMETFEYIPRGGYRVKKRDWFVLSGRSDDVVSYTYARTAKGLIKGFTLIWRPEDDARMKQVANVMYQSFVPLNDYVLDENRGRDDRSASVDLTDGIDTPEPDRAASGFFASPDGAVVTHETNVRGCSRVTVGSGIEMETLALDSASELALLSPVKPFTPRSYALFSDRKSAPGAEITIAGFSFPDVMETAALNYGTVTANKAGSEGDDGRLRLSAFLEAGDTGGPLLDGRGAVIGMQLLRGPGAANLPEYVNFAVRADRILAMMHEHGVTFGVSDADGPVDVEDLAYMAGDFTVKVACWK